MVVRSVRDALLLDGEHAAVGIGLVGVRNSHRPTCIYCLGTKDDALFNREHVLPESFGTLTALEHRHDTDLQL